MSRKPKKAEGVMGGNRVLDNDKGVWGGKPFAELDLLLGKVPTEVQKEESRINGIINRLVVSNENPVIETVHGYVAESQRLFVTSFRWSHWRLSELRIAGFHIDGRDFRVTSWGDALSQMLVSFVCTRRDRFDYLEKVKLFDWIAVEDEQSIADSILAGNATVEVPDFSFVCARMQWLCMEFGFNLKDVGIKIDLYTDEEWERKIAVDLARKRTGKSLATTKRASSRGVANNKIKQKEPRYRDGNTGLGWPRLSEIEQIERNVIRSRPRSNATSPYHQNHFDSGTYIVHVGGEVEFVKPGGNSKTDGIARSESETGEDWKGLGHIARDNGRYGTIDGADYTD